MVNKSNIVMESGFQGTSKFLTTKVYGTNMGKSKRNDTIMIRNSISRLIITP